jgi:hypothetical protein
MILGKNHTRLSVRRFGVLPAGLVGANIRRWRTVGGRFLWSAVKSASGGDAKAAVGWFEAVVTLLLLGEPLPVSRQRELAVRLQTAPARVSPFALLSWEDRDCLALLRFGEGGVRLPAHLELLESAPMTPSTPLPDLSKLPPLDAAMFHLGRAFAVAESIQIRTTNPAQTIRTTRMNQWMRNPEVCWMELPRHLRTTFAGKTRTLEIEKTPLGEIVPLFEALGGHLPSRASLTAQQQFIRGDLWERSRRYSNSGEDADADAPPDSLGSPEIPDDSSSPDNSNK